MSEEIERLIVHDLSKHRSRNELIRAVCEQAGLNWKDGERLVQDVEQKHRQTIARKQGPFLMLLSVGILVIGVILLIYGMQFFAAFLQGDTMSQILSARSAYYRLAGAVTGTGMVIGGLIGIWQTIMPLLDQ